MLRCLDYRLTMPIDRGARPSALRMSEEYLSFRGGEDCPPDHCRSGWVGTLGQGPAFWLANAHVRHLEILLSPATSYCGNDWTSSKGPLANACARAAQAV